MFKRILAFCLTFFSAIVMSVEVVFANDGIGSSLEADTVSMSLRLAIKAAILLFILISLAIVFGNRNATTKRIFFGSIAVIVMGTTFTLGFLTIRLNKSSWTGGPIHWHADMEVWECDRELDIKDPEGYSNKIGTASLHEHNDKRIHYEGVVVNPEDAALAHFFEVIGGSFTSKALSIPTNQGMASMLNGQSCVFHDQVIPAEIQTFVFQTQPDGRFSQRKVDGPHYIMAAESQVPPGDCIIIEYAVVKDKTEHRCKSYEVGLTTGKLKGEIKE